jgi:hypothetical protein
MSDAKTIYQIPGSRGPSGVDGINGTNGQNAFTATTASFTMPGEYAYVTVAVESSTWASIGQNVHVTGCGHMEVISKPSATQMVLMNIRQSQIKAYMGNVSPGTVVTAGKRISPSGLQGPVEVAYDNAKIQSGKLYIKNNTTGDWREIFLTGTGDDEELSWV